MQRIDIPLQPSKWLIGLLGCVLIGSIGVIVSLSLPGLVKILLIIITLAYGTASLWVTGLMKGTRSIIGLQLLTEGGCQLHYPSHTITAAIEKDSTVTAVLCVLRFKVPGQRLRPSCVIFKDALEGEKYRQLLVWLRCC